MLIVECDDSLVCLLRFLVQLPGAIHHRYGVGLGTRELAYSLAHLLERPE